MKQKSPREQKLDKLIHDLPYFSTSNSEVDSDRQVRRTIGYFERWL